MHTVGPVWHSQSSPLTSMFLGSGQKPENPKEHIVTLAQDQTGEPEAVILQRYPLFHSTTQVCVCYTYLSLSKCDGKHVLA